jgi:succinate dehydrogenase / fumarate reductase, cytochrome b subunit
MGAGIVSSAAAVFGRADPAERIANGAIVKDVREALMVSRNTDGKLVRRPLSPHLQVYKMQITTALSILHRITGVALAVGSLFMVCWLVSAASSPEAYYGVRDFTVSWLGRLLMFGWTAALIYHLCNGVRHLAWDAGFGFEEGEYKATGLAVLAATAIGTVLIWLVLLIGG